MFPRIEMRVRFLPRGMQLIGKKDTCSEGPPLSAWQYKSFLVMSRDNISCQKTIKHVKNLLSISMHIGTSAIFGTQFQSKKKKKICTLHYVCTT